MAKTKAAKLNPEALMEIVNMHEAKTHLSRLVKKAAAGESFVIAVSGKPMVKVVALGEVKPTRRYGFLDGKYEMPISFKEAYREEIEEMFYGKS